tara:strand:+ start:1023 stop:1874 length:852 start_codon:yes stop_codon:yes gene_type:complete
VSTNRLLPWQFAPGLDCSATRVEHALLELVALYNDVPADLVNRRWSPSYPSWHVSPEVTATPRTLPFMSAVNNTATGTSSVATNAFSTFQNPYRAKSNAVPSLVPGITYNSTDLLTWEVSLSCSRPTIIGSVWCMAERQATGAYTNNWIYGAVPPPDKVVGAPTTDFTMQACVSDGWDLENRKKLRQEALVWRMRSDAFAFSRSAGVAADTIVPAHPIGLFRGFGVAACPLVLVPAQGRVRVQFTIPRYGIDAASSDLLSTWGFYPNGKNVWTLGLQMWEHSQ